MRQHHSPKAVPPIIAWLAKRVNFEQHGSRGRKDINGERLTFEGANPVEQMCSLITFANAQVLAYKSGNDDGALTTVADHLDYFVHNILPHERMKEGTRRTRVNECANLRNIMGQRIARGLTQAHINQHCMLRGCRDATMRNEINTLRRAITRSREALDLDLFPLKFATPKNPKPSRKTYEQSQLDRIFVGLGRIDLRYARVARLAYASGQRIEVVLKVRWSHLVEKDGMLCVNFDLAKDAQDGTKNGALVPIKGKLAKLLDPIMPEERNSELICEVPDSERKRLDRALVQVLIDLGLREDRKRANGEPKQKLWHTFRASRVTHMLLAGASVTTVAALTSNDLQTVQQYYAEIAKTKDLGDALDQED